jgi:hypothetical protein
MLRYGLPMSVTLFRLYLLVLFSFVALSTTEILGAMLGAILGVAFAMLFMTPSILIAWLLQEASIPARPSAVCVLLMALYGLFIVRQARIAWQFYRLDRSAEARWYSARAAMLTSLPLMGWQSLNELVQTWPR